MGLGALVNQGVQGDRYIVARTITAVEFLHLKGGGFISFDFAGKNPPRGGVYDAMADENAVRFEKAHENDFVRLKNELVRFLANAPRDYVIARAQDRTNVPQAGNSSTSVADRLEKLVQLRDSGALTDAEFQAQKNAALNSR